MGATGRKLSSTSALHLSQGSPVRAFTPSQTHRLPGCCPEGLLGGCLARGSCRGSGQHPAPEQVTVAADKLATQRAPGPPHQDVKRGKPAKDGSDARWFTCTTDRCSQGTTTKSSRMPAREVGPTARREATQQRQTQSRGGAERAAGTREPRHTCPALLAGMLETVHVGQ